METLADRLIAARVGAIEEWQREHASAMASHDLDEALEEVLGLWREICTQLDQAPESKRHQHLQWLVDQDLYTRMLAVVEDARSAAQRIGYFDRGFQFSRRRVDGLVSALRRARETGKPSERMNLELDLDELPRRIPTEA